jgi:hypothetical protein
MDEQTFQDKLLCMLKEIKEFPEEKRRNIEAIAGELGKKYQELLKTLFVLQDTLDSLRLNVKYLLFDLETTKDENTALRKKLKEQDDL